MKASYTLHLNNLRQGNERGLAFFYRLWYHRYYYWGLKYTKDDVSADCIVSEAFLRLWLVRGRMETVAQLEAFIRKLIADGCRAYYSTGSGKFQRSMLRLDEIAGYQDWMAGFDPGMENDVELPSAGEPDGRLKEQWAQVEGVIPSLEPSQQLFVRLCIKYGFDYGRIAWHIGGISDVEVARRVAGALASLRATISDAQKLDVAPSASLSSFAGGLDDEQSAILRMRYELGYSFGEIAAAMGLEQGHVQKVFAGAMAGAERAVRPAQAKKNSRSTRYLKTWKRGKW